VRAINYALTATADFLEQFVIAKVIEDFSGSRGFPFIRCSDAIMAVGVNDPGYSVVVE
jgi:hypothetical protein